MRAGREESGIQYTREVPFDLYYDYINDYMYFLSYEWYIQI